MELKSVKTSQHFVQSITFTATCNLIVFLCMLIILSFPVRLSRAYKSQWEKQKDLTGRVVLLPTFCGYYYFLIYIGGLYFSLVFALHVTRES